MTKSVYKDNLSKLLRILIEVLPFSEIISADWIEICHKDGKTYRLIVDREVKNLLCELGDSKICIERR